MSNYSSPSYFLKNAYVQRWVMLPLVLMGVMGGSLLTLVWFNAHQNHVLMTLEQKIQQRSRWQKDQQHVFFQRLQRVTNAHSLKEALEALCTQKLTCISLLAYQQTALKKGSLCCQRGRFRMTFLDEETFFTLLTQLPILPSGGYVFVHGFSIKKLQTVTSEILVDVAVGKDVALFEGEVDFEWIYVG